MKLFADSNDSPENQEEFFQKTKHLSQKNGIISEMLILVGTVEIMHLHRKHT